MAAIHLTAIDTLFFKDGRPFSMGEETWAEGVFPPFPSVFYGMLRSLWFSENLSHLAEANQPTDPSLSLKIGGLLPTIAGEIVFPVPNDLFRQKGQSKEGTQKLKCVPVDPNFVTDDYPCNYILQTNESGKVEELAGIAFLKKCDFEEYLSDVDRNFHLYDLDDFVIHEPKVGIGRNRITHSSDDGLLYRVTMRRLHSNIREGGGRSFGFALKFDGLNLPDKGLSRLGAENKCVEYNECKSDWNVKCPLKPNDRHFKIYLATPAVFEEGFYPQKWFSARGYTLLAASFGRVQNVGGFDMSAGRPKPMRKAVPAGTVYYVEAPGGISQSDIDIIHGRSIYNLNTSPNAFHQEYERQGFGLSYLGKFRIH